MDERDIELIKQLEQKLDDIGFEGDFFDLGITPLEALMMDKPSLARKINEITGVSKAFADEVEARNRQKNAQMNQNFNSTEWSRF